MQMRKKHGQNEKRKYETKFETYRKNNSSKTNSLIRKSRPISKTINRPISMPAGDAQRCFHPRPNCMSIYGLSMLNLLSRRLQNQSIKRPAHRPLSKSHLHPAQHCHYRPLSRASTLFLSPHLLFPFRKRYSFCHRFNSHHSKV